MDSAFKVIALTGGPCGGKTGVLSELEQQLSDRGVAVVTVPEHARLFIKGGVGPATVDPVAFQKGIIGAGLAYEDEFSKLARGIKADRVVMICDRGVLDSEAYLDGASFESILSATGLRRADLFARYDAVIHLVTAADGAEEFYVNDKERLETPEQARERDLRGQNAWNGHPHLRVVDNSTDFAEKKRRVLREILSVLGMPVPLEIERKYEVSKIHWESLLRQARKISIEQAYLPAPAGGEERIRKRSIDGHAVYYRTLKRVVRPGVREEREWRISPQEYADAYEVRSKGMNVIRKDRWCFLYKGQYFELDDFAPMGLKRCVLEIELTDESQEVALPPWLRIVREVTHEPAFTNYEIARAA